MTAEASPSTSTTTVAAESESPAGAEVPEGPIHLLVLIHGMWGNPMHLAEARRVMEETRGGATAARGPGGERVRVLVAETNRDDGTYDGIDWGGERVAEEVRPRLRAACARCSVLTNTGGAARHSRVCAVRRADIRGGEATGKGGCAGDAVLGHWLQPGRAHRAIRRRVRLLPSLSRKVRG